MPWGCPLLLKAPAHLSCTDSDITAFNCDILEALHPRTIYPLRSSRGETEGPLGAGSLVPREMGGDKAGIGEAHLELCCLPVQNRSCLSLVSFNLPTGQWQGIMTMYLTGL